MSIRLALLFALLLPCPALAKDPFRFPTASSGKAQLKYLDHVPVLVVDGSPADIGAAVGTLAIKPSKRVLHYPRELLRCVDADSLWSPLLTAGKGMFKSFPTEYRDELEAAVMAAGVDRDLLIAGNTFFDVKKSFACSALLIEADRSATGAPLLARNLDYPSLGYIHEYSLVTIYRPTGRLAFASIGFPGLLGVLSGMNEAGLCLGVLEVFDVKTGETHFDAKGVTYGLCLRQVLERAKTIDEAVKVLQGLRRTTTINVAIADRTGVAVLEITPTKVIRRNAARGVCVCTNHFCTDELKPEDPLDRDDSFERFAVMEKMRTQTKKVSVADLHKQLDEVNLGTQTLQTMAFEPATLKLHLSIGKVPATKGTLRVLDLSPLLRKGERRDVSPPVQRLQSRRTYVAPLATTSHLVRSLWIPWPR